MHYITSIPTESDQMQVKITYSTAMAAGRDAGNKSMRAAGRTAWNADDWAASCAVFNRLMGL